MYPRFPREFNNAPSNVVTYHAGKSVLAFYKISQMVPKTEGFLTEHTLIFIIRGTKKIHLGDQAIDAKVNELILLKRGAYFMSTFLAEKDGFAALMLCMDDDFLKQFVAEHTDLQAITSSTEHARMLVSCSKEITSVRDNILHYIQHPHENTTKLLQLKLEELFLLLLAGEYKLLFLHFLQQLFDKSDDAMEITIKANLLKPFALQDYAKLCGLSLSSFKREFARLFNTAPKEWINNERLLHANRLLETTSKNVNEVADECGFENVSYFIKCYKARFGNTPKEATRAKTANF
ncbi:AraC family transcriptional regulator [Paraflavitalea speifideaquila]|uniref:helix-turn-helix transcriptional regulator n=1 Tax=Paraflavitalea speifideaquila TaxID=3076558 RepID=UPI0028E1EDB1|nr:AraC family transcriptional regulator [Paraflavitalea speifideiaquila]